MIGTDDKHWLSHLNPTLTWPIILLLIITSFILFKLFDFHTIRHLVTNYRRYNKIPGPKGWLFIGSALRMSKKKPFETFMNWAKEYGDVYMVTLFGKKILILSGVEVIEEALVTRGNDFAGRPTLYYRAKFMSEGSHDIVSSSPCPVWKILRKGLQREMKMFDPSLKRVESLINLILDELIFELESTNGAVYDPREAVYTSIINTNCLFITGNKLENSSEMLEDVKNLVNIITKVMNLGGPGAELDYFPWLRYFGNKTFAKLVEAKELRNKVFGWMIEKMKHDIEHDTGENGVMHGFYKLLIDGKEGITVDHLKLVMTNLLIGSTASSNNYMYLFLNIMAHYPNVQQLIYEEIIRAIGQDRRPRLADRQDMPYTKACLLELLRYGSMSPIFIPHCTVVDTKIKNYDIPAGTTVFIMSRYVHHNPDLWTEPFIFDPTRFIDPLTNDVVGPDNRKRKNVISFGSGPRGCPGEALAMCKFFLFVTNLVQKFKIEPKDNEEVSMICNPREFELGLVTKPTSYSVKFLLR